MSRTVAIGKREAKYMVKKSVARMSMWELRSLYDNNKDKRNKEMAEIAYALSLSIKKVADRMGPGFADAKKDYYDKARMYAAQCVEVLESLPRNTLDEVTVSSPTLAGVVLPNYFYLECVLEIPEFRELLQK